MVKGIYPGKVNPMLVIGVLALLVLVAIFLRTEGFVGVDASGSRVDASGSRVDASGSTVALRQDGSGNMITLSIADLLRALSSSAERPNTVTKTAVISTSETVPPPSPSTFPRFSAPSAGLSSEDEKRISATVAKQVKDSLLAERSTTPVLPTAAASSGKQPESNSCAQGMDYSENSPFAPWNDPNYVRKDSIPCWGCTLPQ